MSKELYISRRIEMIERELNDLKSFVTRGDGTSINLRGIWEEADITDEEIEQAKRSLLSGIELDDSG